MRTTNMAVLAVRGAGSTELERVVGTRKGKVGGTCRGLPLFGFTSPTDAVLAGLELCGAGGGVAAAVTAGEVGEADGSLAGRAAEAASDLAAAGKDGELLLTEAVFFAMNRNEVSAVPTDLPARGAVDQRIYRAEARLPVRHLEAGPPPGAAAGGGRGGSELLALVGVLLAFGVGYLLHGPGAVGLPTLGDELPVQAQALAAAGQHREAVTAYEAAYRAHPGRPELEVGYRESTLKAAELLDKGGRPDAAFGLLHRAVQADPWRPDLEDRLLEVGLEYLGKLAESEAPTASATEELRLLKALPLREREIRDRLVEVKVARIMADWRRPEGGQDRYDMAHQVDALWRDSPGHPALHYTLAEFYAADGRYEKVATELRAALQKRPGWATERPELARLAMKVLEKLDEASDRKNHLEAHVDFCIQSLAKPLEEAMRKALAGEAVGPRAGAFLFFQKLGTLTDSEKNAYYEANLAGVSAVGEKEGPLKDPALLEDAIRYASAQPDKARWVRALDKALASPELQGDERDLVRKAREALGGPGG